MRHAHRHTPKYESLCACTVCNRGTQLIALSYPHIGPSVLLCRSFIGEESVAKGEACVLTDKPTWIIDPVDGTTNFVHG